MTGVSTDANVPLAGMRVVEGSAFVAAPSGGMSLARLGAEVIRFDPVEGALDGGRWPLAPTGTSLFWTGLNKGKKSIRVDLRRPEGRELVTSLISAPGADAGIFLTNFPARGWLSFAELQRHRQDLIMIELQGNNDGSSEVDYTVHPATGFPWATGPSYVNEPTNSLLPSWDLLLGAQAAMAILAADRVRARTGRGDLVQIALSDVAFATVGDLGRIAQVELGGSDTTRDGNYLYGSFGHDFLTLDGRRLMVVALTNRQWEALKRVTGTDERFAELAVFLREDLETEGGRYRSREFIASVLRPWFAQHTLSQLRQMLSGTGVSWGPYQTFDQLVHEDPRCSAESPIFQHIDQPGVGEVLTPRSPMRWTNTQTPGPLRAPMPGEHTDEVLATVLGKSSREIGQLRDRGIVA